MCLFNFLPILSIHIHAYEPRRFALSLRKVYCEYFTKTWWVRVIKYVILFKNMFYINDVFLNCSHWLFTWGNSSRSQCTIWGPALCVWGREYSEQDSGGCDQIELQMTVPSEYTLRTCNVGNQSGCLHLMRAQPKIRCWSTGRWLPLLHTHGQDVLNWRLSSKIRIRGPHT